MNLYINIPYKTGKHKNETENTNFIRLYIKISISPFFFFLTLSVLGSAVWEPTESVQECHNYWKHKHAKKWRQTPTDTTWNCWHPKWEFNWGRGYRGQENQSEISQHLLTEHTNLLRVFLTLLFFFRLFWFNLFELKYTKKCTRIHQLNN